MARARAGEGPTLLEFKTYKHRGHFEGDNGTYRPQEEVDAWIAKDPMAYCLDPIINQAAKMRYASL